MTRKTQQMKDTRVPFSGAWLGAAPQSFCIITDFLRRFVGKGRKMCSSFSKRLTPKCMEAKAFPMEQRDKPEANLHVKHRKAKRMMRVVGVVLSAWMTLPFLLALPLILANTINQIGQSVNGVFLFLPIRDMPSLQPPSCVACLLHFSPSLLEFPMGGDQSRSRSSQLPYCSACFASSFPERATLATRDTLMRY